MPHQLLILPKAEEDIFSSFLWYEEHKNGLGIAFQAAVETSINQLFDHPLHYQIRYGGNIRIKFLEKFPYGIHYAVMDSTILIISCLSTRESPDKWVE